MKFREARLVSVPDGTVGEPQDLWIADGRISRYQKEPASDVINLDGRFVLPGLWDTHTHFTSWTLSSHRIDLSGARSASEAARRVAAALSEAGPGPLLGGGLTLATWPDQPDTALLDQHSGDRPVVLNSSDLHSVWANSAALRLFGFGDRADGSPSSGFLREADSFAMQSQVNDVDPAILDRWILEAEQAAAAQGVVGILDVEKDWMPGIWARRFADGINLLRVEAAFWSENLDRAITAGLHTGMVLDEAGLLTCGPLKIITDGSLGSSTAWCFEPLGRPVPQMPYGESCISRDDLFEQLQRATNAGLDVAVHAIGDRAVSQALDAFEETHAHGSIEHAQLLAPGDFERFARLDVRASVQPDHLVGERDTLDAQWGERNDRAYAFRSFLDAGVRVSLGSDAPVVALDPWRAIQAAVLRSLPGEQPWHPEQCLRVGDALFASTQGVRGLVPGAAADLMVLDANPFEADPSTLAGTPVHLTMMAGRITHRTDAS